MRRLSAIFEVLQKCPNLAPSSKAEKSVKFLTDRLGEARSLDVSLKLLRQRFPLPFLKKELKAWASQGRRDLPEKIGKKRPATLARTIQKILEKMERSHASHHGAWAGRLVRAERRARLRHSIYRSDPRIENLHQLRIRLKQWRYLLELADSNAEAQQEIEILKRLQDDIGELHDIEVLREHLGKRRMKRIARKHEAELELKEIRRRLKADLATGQRTFLSRHERVLARIFAKEEA